jgi:alpha-N-acetylglucosaminidase
MKRQTAPKLWYLIRDDISPGITANRTRWICFALFWILSLGGAKSKAADDFSAVQGLIERIAPGHGNDFVLETIPVSAGQVNVFGIGSRDGKILLRGDTQLSLCVAFNYYLKHDALADVSWYIDDSVTLPKTLPLPSEVVQRSTAVKDRFFLNYCTFGYTMPYWRWRDWERAIDWMALNGINLPLAQNGNEYVWQKVWKDYGLSDEQIRGFFSGPAHLPWHRMVNIDHWDGPLPQSFIDGQHDLQKQILGRERELGMRPILCAFAGHVPEALKTAQPGVKIERIPPGWGGFPKEFGCWFLSPLDPKFHEIQVKFLQAQKAEYGESHYLGTDPFNEISPPSWEPDYLASVSKAIYDGMAEVDPQAIWIQMAWTFNSRKSWTDPRLSAMIKAVPAGKMELLDYVCENGELFRKTQAFYGAPFVWDYLGNFGGNTNLVGPMNKINTRLTAVMNDPSITNFHGVGATLEGFNNPVVYEMLFERPWDGPAMDLQKWVHDEAKARAGSDDPAVEQAWDILRSKVLVDNVDPIGTHDVIFQFKTPDLHKADGEARDPYKLADLIQAWKLLLDAGPQARSNSAYQRDLVDTTRQSLGNIGLILQKRMTVAYDQHDLAAFTKAADDFMMLGRDIDDFLASRSDFMIGKWIADAKSWAAKDEEPYYEQNARTIITTWGGHSSALSDYAGRQWNGLMRDYYLPRWQMLIDASTVELKGGPKINPAALKKQYEDHNWAFARGVGGNYSVQPHGDIFAMSRSLFDRYSNIAPAAESGSAATWTPATVSKDFAELKFPLDKKLPRTGELHVRLQYDSGANALEIQSVAIKMAGKLIAEDRHAGWTGNDNRENEYGLRWPADVGPGAATLVVIARGAGGSDSSGSIYVENK